MYVRLYAVACGGPVGLLLLLARLRWAAVKTVATASGYMCVRVCVCEPVSFESTTCSCINSRFTTEEESM